MQSRGDCTTLSEMEFKLRLGLGLGLGFGLYGIYGYMDGLGIGLAVGTHRKISKRVACRI